MSVHAAALALSPSGARAAAVEALVAPPLVAAQGRAFVLGGLADEDFFVRRAVADAVVRFGPAPGIIDALATACRDEKISLRSSAFSVLSDLGAPAIGVLTDLMAEDHAGYRRFAAEALGGVRDAESRALLVGHLRDPSPAVRGACVDALAEDAEANPAGAITSLLRREVVPSVQISCLLALRKLNALIDAPLVRRFVGGALTDAHALILLARTGDMEAVQQALASGNASRQSAGIAALGGAFVKRPQDVLRVATAVAVAQDVALRALAARDPLVVRGALCLAAAQRRADWFHEVARRSDVEEHAPAAHSVVALLEDTRFARDLAAVAQTTIHERARAFLLELSAAVLQRERSTRADATRATNLLETEDFERLADTFRRAAGLRFDSDAAFRVESRLLPRLRATGLASFRAYVDLVRSETEAGDRELLRALDRVTIHETYFFRELRQLDTFRTRGIPHLQTLRPRPIRILSAGCATGEEAYTLAMLLLDTAGIAPSDVEVIGIDVSEDVIDCAKKGVYGRRGLRGDMPAELKNRYLESLPNGRMKVRPVLHERVTFARQNLADEETYVRLPRFHAVFCRNVLIYLTAQMRQRIVDNFYARLQPGGLLFLGHSESLLNMDTRFRFMTAGKDLVYVKPHRDGSLPTLGEP